jgi:hypothetical protein
LPMWLFCEGRHTVTHIRFDPRRKPYSVFGRHYGGAGYGRQRTRRRTADLFVARSLGTGCELWPRVLRGHSFLNGCVSTPSAVA